MTSSILNFFAASKAPRNWTNQELAEFYRVADSLNQTGLAVETDLGISDEGEPWFAFYHPETAEVVAHFARIDGQFVAAGALLNDVVTGRDLREIIERLMRTRSLVMPVAPKGAGNLLLHPVIVLTAFVATALLQLQDAEAAPLAREGQKHSSGGESHSTGSDAQSGDAAHAAAAHGEKPQKAAPTLIQQLKAAYAEQQQQNGKSAIADKLLQGFEHAALLSAVAFAVTQVPAYAHNLDGSDLLQSNVEHATIVQAAEAGAAIAIQSLAQDATSHSTQVVMDAGTGGDAALVASGSHGAAAAASAIASELVHNASALVNASELVMAPNLDAATQFVVIKPTADLLDLLDALAAAGIARHTSPAAEQAVPVASATLTKVEGASAVTTTTKSLEVTLTVDAAHSTFLQSALFRELFDVKSVEVTGSTKNNNDGAAGGAPSGDKPPAETVTVVVILNPETEKPADLPSTGTPITSTPDPAPATDQIVKTGIAMYDHIIDFSYQVQAENVEHTSLAGALADITHTYGNLLDGTKKIVVFESRSLSLEIYKLSADVIMIDREMLHLTHDQASHGLGTTTVQLPNGGFVELLGVLASPSEYL